MNLGNISRAEVPSQRWALPSDSDYDKYANDFEHWLNDNYDDKSQMIAGRHMTWEQACEDEWLFDVFLEEHLDRDGDYDD